MYKESIEQAAKRLIDSGLASPRDMKGCTAGEIEQIESAYRIHLPAAYVAFMTRMGKGAGRFLEGSDFFFPAPLNLRADAERLLEECNAKFSFKKTDFVFGGHQGYQFLFLSTEVSDDPPVFIYVEEEDPRQVYDRFSEWLLGCVADDIAAVRDLRS